jgi:hypothetical protein
MENLISENNEKVISDQFLKTVEEIAPLLSPELATKLKDSLTTIEKALDDYISERFKFTSDSKRIIGLLSVLMVEKIAQFFCI